MDPAVQSYFIFDDSDDSHENSEILAHQTFSTAGESIYFSPYASRRFSNFPQDNFLHDSPTPAACLKQ